MYLSWGVEPTFRSVLGHYLREVYWASPPKTAASVEKVLAQLLSQGAFIVSNLTLTGLLAALFGLILLSRRERLIGGLLLALAALGTVGLLPFIKFDVEREELFASRVFLMPAYLVLGVGIAVAAAEAARVVPTVTRRPSYDNLNRVVTITRQDPATSGWTSIATWTFQGPARMITMESGNSCKEVLTYDVYGRAVDMTHDRLHSTGVRKTMFYFKRGYDNGNRVTRERRNFYDNSGNQLTTNAKDHGDLYEYDHQNRLATVVRGAGSVTKVLPAFVDTAATSTTDFALKAKYTFDGAGNRKTLQYDNPAQPIAQERHTFNSENELTTKALYLYDHNQSTWGHSSSTPIAYDVNGNHISTGPTVKVDIENRIYESGNWRYRYDPFGRRVEKRDTGGTFWQRCYYDGIVCIAQWHTTLVSSVPTESTTGPMWVRIFGTYLVDQLLWGKVDPCGACGTYYGGFAHLDFLGSQVMITEETGNGSGGYNIYETYRYDEYGQPYFFDGSGTSLPASQVGLDHLYTGRVWDAELGVYFYRARYYDQTSGRFLGRDSFRSNVQFNSYGYVDLRPLEFVDPLGLSKVQSRILVMRRPQDDRPWPPPPPPTVVEYQDDQYGPGPPLPPLPPPPLEIEPFVIATFGFVTRTLESACDLLPLPLRLMCRQRLQDFRTDGEWCMRYPEQCIDLVAEPVLRFVLTVEDPPPPPPPPPPPWYTRLPMLLGRVTGAVAGPVIDGYAEQLRRFRHCMSHCTSNNSCGHDDDRRGRLCRAMTFAACTYLCKGYAGI